MVKYIDLHCDTITKCLENNENLYKNNFHIDIERLKKYSSGIQFFAIWLKKYLYKNAYFETKKAIDFFNSEIEKNKKYIKKAISFEDILKNQNENKFSAILSIEGGECLMGDISKLDELYLEGIRMFSLTWNYENELGYGVFENEKLPLKELGKLAIKKMNKLGIIIDVSHLNEGGFWDIYNISEKPFIASHSNSYYICNNKRNLKDMQIKAIKERGGVIGINLYKNFLTNKETANLDDIFRHIDYIAKLIGFDNICLGGDLDGIDETIKGINDILGYKYLFENLVRKYKDTISEKIFYDNFYKFLKDNLKK